MSEQRVEEIRQWLTGGIRANCSPWEQGVFRMMDDLLAHLDTLTERLREAGEELANERKRWLREKPIYANPACSGCGGPHAFDTTVPSPTWNRVIRGAGRPDYLCLVCIVKAFAQAEEGLTAELIGDGLDFVPIEVRIRSAEAVTARDLSEENTKLRWNLSQAEAQRDDALAGAHAIRCTCLPERRDPRCVELQGVAGAAPAEPGPDPLGGFRLGLQR